MNDPYKIDFSLLDPARDGDRFEAMVGAVVARATRMREHSVAAQLRAWARPALAMAAVLALIIWVGGIWRGEAQASSEPTTVLAQWALADEIPSATAILEVLGDDHATQ